MVQKRLKVGELINPNNGYVLNATEVESYNRYSDDIAEMARKNNKSAVEILKDNRHKYLVLAGA